MFERKKYFRLISTGNRSKIYFLFQNEIYKKELSIKDVRKNFTPSSSFRKMSAFCQSLLSLAFVLTSPFLHPADIMTGTSKV